MEGFSAPLQFALATGWFAAGGSGVDGFFVLQIVSSTMLLGVAFFVLASIVAPDRSLSRRVLGASLVAVPVFASYRFFGWHSSGMENAITNALLACTLALLALGLRRHRWLWVASTSAGLLSVSRVEFAFHVAPLLVVAAVLLVRRDGARSSALLPLLAPAAGVWIVVQGVRLWYFGALVPNSGVAQRIEPIDNVARLLVVVVPLVFAAAIIGIVRRDRRRAGDDSWPRWAALAFATAAVASFALFVVVRGSREVQDEGATLSRLGILPWVFVALALLVAVRPRLVEANWLLLTVIATGTIHLFVFGQARLSEERVVSFVVVPLAAFVVTLVVRLDLHQAAQGLRGAPVCGAAALALCAMAVFAAVAGPDAYQEEELCCTADAQAARIEQVADHIRVDHGIEIVSVANPDLGALSLRKDVDVTDLGFLGDPVLARLWTESDQWRVTSEVVTYLNEVARPDVVELHGGWACQYAPWIFSPRFEELYEPIAGKPWPERQLDRCTDIDRIRTVVWVRRDLRAGVTSPEVALTRALEHDDAPAEVAAAVEECRSGDGRWRCAWVGRAIFRNQRLLDERGTLDAVRAQLADEPTAAYDRAVLRSRQEGRWYVEAVDALEPLLHRPS